MSKNKVKHKILEYRDFDFGDKYTVYSDGRIFSNVSRRYLKPFNDGRRGYDKVKLYTNDGKKPTIAVHRIILENFNKVDNYLEMVVDHINGDITDNRLENLKWVDFITNQRDKGKRVHRNSTYKYKSDICKMYFIEGCTYKEISEKLNVDQQSASDLINCRRFGKYAEIWCSTHKIPYFVRNKK